MESADSQQTSTLSQEYESNDGPFMSQQTSVVGALSTNSTESDEDTYKSANEKSDDEEATATTSFSERTGESRLKRGVPPCPPPPTSAADISKIPSTDTEIFGWWYQYVNSSLYGKEGEKKSDTDVSEKMSSSMRVVRWLEGNSKSSKAMRRKGKESQEGRKFRKEQSVLVRQEEEKPISKSQQQQQQDASLRGPLSIRPSFIEFLQKISHGKAEPTLEELEKEWPPDPEMFKRIMATPASTEKKEETESEISKTKIEKQSKMSTKSSKSKKSKASSADGKGKKGKKKEKKSKSLKGSKDKITESKLKGKDKKKGSLKRKGSIKSKGSKISESSRGSKASKASTGKKKAKGGKRKKSAGSTGSGRSNDKTKRKAAEEERKAQMRKSFAEAQVRQSIFAENFKKGSRKASEGGFGRAISRTLRKQEKPKCNIPAAIHLYCGERADFLTEGELEEIRQRLNRQIEDKDREKRIPLIRSIHKSVMRLVGFCLKVKPSKVEDGVLDFDSHIELLDSIVSEGGRRIVIFSFHKYGPKGEHNLLDSFVASHCDSFHDSSIKCYLDLSAVCYLRIVVSRCVVIFCPYRYQCNCKIHFSKLPSFFFSIVKIYSSFHSVLKVFSDYEIHVVK
uniref:Plectin n=1 Tax=Lygus hesperus TaxID=30085 RepID=A0A0A9XAW6_LYGHE